ncbi:hypothetical protein QYE76_017759 [Lolium multiflorum]|uniref:Uncharacterized protein n=1 Tax=Lolium multiflorum TaxID=4521 RepID=A0AAD8UZU4_LOLMU|nr:hypothetical protein QYE76_017759 [Lolium multiflorum]
MEYEALDEHELRVATETFDIEMQGVNLKVDEATTAINTVQTSMMTLQASIQNLTQAVGEIRPMVQQPQQPLDEDGSVNGDNAEAAAAQGVGRGIGRGLGRGVGCGFVKLGARRVPPQPQDDDLGKPDTSPTKVSLQIFSELDETKAHGLIFHGVFQNTEGETKRGHEAATPPGAAPPPAAPAYGVGPSGAHQRCPFAYIILPSRKP